MKAKIRLIVVLVSAVILFSCKSSFPAAGTTVECNGQLIKPILNPTKCAEFPGGRQAMFTYFKENLILPKEAINQKIKGKVQAAFIITKNGEICDLRITSKPKEYLDNAVIRVIKMMPKWIPGINEGVKVDCYYLLEIQF